jgi:hypothetical protein
LRVVALGNPLIARGQSVERGGLTVALGGVLMSTGVAITGLHGDLLVDCGRPQMGLFRVDMSVRRRVVRLTRPFEGFARTNLRLLCRRSRHRQPVSQLVETRTQLVCAPPGTICSRLRRLVTACRITHPRKVW